MVFSSSSKSSPPSQVHAYASQTSADASYQNPPPLYGKVAGSAISSQKFIRGERNEYEKQRHQGDYNYQVIICNPQPVSYLQLSSGSSQSVAVELHNLMLDYITSLGAQQRYRRKKNEHRESNNQSVQEEQLVRRFRYEKNIVF